MRRIISFAHVSLDGFVAGPNGEMNWITINQELFDHVGKRIHTGDTAMYGRNTYEMMESYWPTAGKAPNATSHEINHSKWYADIHKIVLSKTLKQEALHNTTVISDDLATNINKIRQQEGPEILIFGSPTATHALMEQGLIDGYWLFLNPVILGKGIPLFAGIKETTKLELKGTHQFNCGVTELSYLVTR